MTHKTQNYSTEKVDFIKYFLLFRVMCDRNIVMPYQGMSGATQKIIISHHRFRSRFLLPLTHCLPSNEDGALTVIATQELDS